MASLKLICLHNTFFDSCLSLFVITGILANFLFTTLAWWRLEPPQRKRWSWVFLLLQLWPQLRAFQVLKSKIYIFKKT